MQHIRIGIVGAGQFAAMAAERFVIVPGVSITAVSNRTAAKAEQLAKVYGARVLGTDELIAADDVDLVYIAAPPATHYPVAKQALQAGKHVICEKPLTMLPDEAEELMLLAESQDCLLAVDLMQRYNPLVQAVATVLSEGLLGAPLHATFENYASDEGLGSAHWFWDRTVSGGIFIEHAVHFFDLFELWFGTGRLLSAQAMHRPDSQAIDQVQCSTQHGGVLAQQYHGFHQAARMDRQETRIVCERGDIRMQGWVPTEFTIHALVNAPELTRLQKLLPETTVESTSLEPGIQARWQSLDSTAEIWLKGGSEADKMTRYGQMLTDFMADQTAWIHDRTHSRLVNAGNGVRSVRLAYEATQAASQQVL